MATIKYTGEEALGRVAEYVNKKLTFASSMPESPDTGTVVLYVGASAGSYLKGGIYQYDGTNWKIINLVQQVELTQEEYEALPEEAKNNGTVYFITDMNIPGSIVSGYYNEVDGLFYEEYTFETEMAENINVLYIDLNTNTTYIYDINEDEYVQTGGGGDGFIQYVTALPPSDVKNIIYGCRTTVLNQYITQPGFLDSDTNFFDSDGHGGYYVNSEVKVKASTVEEEESYKDLNLITYNATNEEFTLHYKDQTTQTLGMNELLFCKITYITYYAGDAENQNFIFLGSGSVEKILLNYYTKEEVNTLIQNHSQIKEATQAEWNAMSQAEKDDPNTLWLLPWMNGGGGGGTTAGVSSFNGRSGSVLPVAGDYDATQINYDANTTVKQKIDTIYTMLDTVLSTAY